MRRRITCSGCCTIIANDRLESGQHDRADITWFDSDVVALTSTSRAADAGFLTLADLSSIAVHLELDYRIVGGHMVTLLTAAHGVVGQVPMRETLDADFAALPAVIADPRLPQALAEWGYRPVDAANRFVRHHHDNHGPLKLLASSSPPVWRTRQTTGCQFYSIFEAGGTVPTLVVLERLARALDMRLDVRFSPLAEAA
ncbi:hypothetical protein ONA70_03600 [Micromonospora yasonensis]|uniref:hypothetical protein n=1 Tax=Micromonospora yasonensis TaxID=1128667 RepID=UPI00222F6A41|nr:hypothetical protein [Micromonospora yasonensis]MCW3839181.1 hypothetical protein [Micromonospora yasonensis]